MARVAKIAITMDGELLREVEELRRSTHESRSAFIGRALRAALRPDRRRSAVEQYRRAYERVPESPEDATRARTLAARALRSLPWD